MNKMIGMLGACLLGTCKNKIEEAKKLINDFDADEAKKELLEMGDKMKEEFKILTDRVKNSIDKYEVNVSYNRETEIMNYTLDNHTLTIQIESKDVAKNQVIQFTIPEDVNLNKIIQKYDENNKIMYFIMNKIF